MTSSPAKPKPPRPILARATAYLPDGIFPGGVYWVSPSSSYIQECIHAGLLVPVDEAPETHELEQE